MLYATRHPMEQIRPCSKHLIRCFSANVLTFIIRNLSQMQLHLVQTILNRLVGSCQVHLLWLELGENGCPAVLKFTVAGRLAPLCSATGRRGFNMVLTDSTVDDLEQGAILTQ